jgi:hypothetical protein
MEKVVEGLLNFIAGNNLSIFGINEATGNLECFKTRDAKAIASKTLNKISDNFIFYPTRSLLNHFIFTQNPEEINKRQEFFSNLNKNLDNEFLKEIKEPRASWTPKYEIYAVTSNEKTFIELKKLGCPVKFITSSEDVKQLESCDVIQAIDCDDISIYLEQLPQTIFINKVEDVYLERNLELLSGWRKNLEVISEQNNLGEELSKNIQELLNLIELIDEEKTEKLTKELVDEKISDINEQIFDKIKELNFSGEVLVKILSGNAIPREVEEIIEQIISENKLPEEVLIKGIPVKVDEKELSDFIRRQETSENTSMAEKIKIQASRVREIPKKLGVLEADLLLFDFFSGINKFLEKQDNLNLAKIDNILEILDSKNVFLENAQDISFLLDEDSKCSILTGANSGGKTTLLEHIIQLLVLANIGLPISGKIKFPLLSEIYYFAKSKGSTNKGAFETLLTQMSKIQPRKTNETLILADEIESVTEPGVAGKILCATSDYFIQRGCFLVIATHLGQEIKPHLPKKARIDGIEAQGLDENFNLIVHHNPILGKLAHSTPELIVEKMAKSNGNDYLKYLWEYMKTR